MKLRNVRQNKNITSFIRMGLVPGEMKPRSEKDLICSECKDCFESASSLLKHFAAHALEATAKFLGENFTDQNADSDGNHRLSNKKSIPDLHPITNINRECQNDIVNPITFCEVTMSEEKLHHQAVDSKNNETTLGKRKKYKCIYCSKHFGWPTDLKRHILIHTGERPFKCELCSVSFTRNFLLQKHKYKFHNSKYDKKPKIPDLKPIYSVLKAKMKKQTRKPKVNLTVANENCSSTNKIYEIMRKPIYSS